MMLETLIAGIVIGVALTIWLKPKVDDVITIKLKKK